MDGFFRRGRQSSPLYVITEGLRRWRSPLWDGADAIDASIGVVEWVSLSD
jgi:hypothetical protein